jgi:hypothetical protein
MTETTTEKKSTSAANKAYGAATAELRERYRAEFDALLTAKRAEMGLPPVNRRTPEQVEADKAAAVAAKAEAKATVQREKALATAQALAAEYPDLIVVRQSVDSPF